MQVTIRNYQPADRRHLARCLDAISDYTAGLDPWHRRVRTPDHSARWIPFFLALVARNHGFILVAEADGQAAGVAIAWTYRMTGPDQTKNLPTKIGSVSELSVLPSWRGKGIGTRLLRECEGRFRSSGCDQLNLSAFAHNRKALHLYAREGYEARYLVMGKQLGPPKLRWARARTKPRRTSSC